MSGVEGSALYAFALGLVGALNPCGFPLLPAYLSSFVGSPSAPVAARVARGLSSGGLASIGFVGLFGLLGLLVESGVHLLFGWVPYVMIPFGCVLTTMNGSDPPIRNTPGITKTSPRTNGRRESAFWTKLSSPGPRSIRADPA